MGPEPCSETPTRPEFHLFPLDGHRGMTQQDPLNPPCRPALLPLGPITRRGRKIVIEKNARQIYTTPFVPPGDVTSLGALPTYVVSYVTKRSKKKYFLGPTWTSLRPLKPHNPKGALYLLL